MPTKNLIRETCSKRGLILTCYVDGRKRFKSTILTDGAGSRNAPVSTENQTRPETRR